jgi:hypothetical protein
MMKGLPQMFFKSPSNLGSYHDLSLTGGLKKWLEELSFLIARQMRPAPPTPSRTLDDIRAISVIVGNEIMNGSRGQTNVQRDLPGRTWIHCRIENYQPFSHVVVALGSLDPLPNLMLRKMRKRLARSAHGNLPKKSGRPLSHSSFEREAVLGVHGLPAYSTGYLNWLQFALLAGPGVPMAVVGTKVAHGLPSNRLRLVSAIVLVCIGMKMMGMFSWLWPSI